MSRATALHHPLHDAAAQLLIFAEQSTSLSTIRPAQRPAGSSGNWKRRRRTASEIFAAAAAGLCICGTAIEAVATRRCCSVQPVDQPWRAGPTFRCRRLSPQSPSTSSWLCRTLLLTTTTTTNGRLIISTERRWARPATFCSVWEARRRSATFVGSHWNVLTTSPDCPWEAVDCHWLLLRRRQIVTVASISYVCQGASFSVYTHHVHHPVCLPIYRVLQKSGTCVTCKSLLKTV